MENRFPYENNISLYGDPENVGAINARFLEMQEQARTETEAAKLQVAGMESYRYLNMFGRLEGGQFRFEQSSLGSELPVFMDVMPLEDFNHMSVIVTS